MSEPNGVGNRCDIFRSIDSLDKVNSARELARALKPILNALAYDMVTGDSSVNAYQEEWHEQYTAALYEEAGAEAAARGHPEGKAPARAELRPEPRPEARLAARQESRQAAAAYEPRQAAAAYEPRQPRPVARPSQRAAVPKSLQSIMDGTHPSLHDS